MNTPDPGSATWRGRPIAVLVKNLRAWLDHQDKIRAMTNAELVRECLKTEAADSDITNEMMTRLHPGWENEPDDRSRPTTKLTAGTKDL